MKKLFSVFTMMTACLFLTGCSASVNLIHTYDTEYFYEQIQIVVNETQVEAVDFTGTPVMNYPNEKWTLSAYIPKYFQAINVLLPTYDRYELISETVQQGKHVWTFQKKIPIASYSDKSVKITRKDSFYLHTYSVKRPNPFNGVRDQFNAITPDDTMTPLSILKNGKFVVSPEGIKLYELPSLFAAFTYFGDVYDNPDSINTLALNFLMKDSKRLKNAGTTLKTQDGTYYLWESKFSQDDKTIEYSYYRANSLGWNITALLAAALIVTALIFFTRNKKSKPSSREKFPYQPDEYKNLY